MGVWCTWDSREHLGHLLGWGLKNWIRIESKNCQNKKMDEKQLQQNLGFLSNVLDCFSFLSDHSFLTNFFTRHPKRSPTFFLVFVSLRTWHLCLGQEPVHLFQCSGVHHVGGTRFNRVFAWGQDRRMWMSDNNSRVGKNDSAKLKSTIINFSFHVYSSESSSRVWNFSPLKNPP